MAIGLIAKIANNLRKALINAHLFIINQFVNATRNTGRILIIKCTITANSGVLNSDVINTRRRTSTLKVHVELFAFAAKSGVVNNIHRVHTRVITHHCIA